MKHIFQIMALILAVLMTASVFAGCAKEEKSTVAETTAESTEATKTAETVETKEEEEEEEEEEVLLGEEFTYEHMHLTLPVGFTAQPNGEEALAVPEGYPTLADNIAFSKYGKDDIGIYSKEYLDNGFKDIFPGFKKSTVFEVYKLDGVDALTYCFELTDENGVEMVQTIYAIFGETYSNKAIFTNVSGEFEKAFDASAATLHVVG